MDVGPSDSRDLRELRGQSRCVIEPAAVAHIEYRQAHEEK